jgi:hypothetical protein
MFRPDVNCARNDMIPNPLEHFRIPGSGRVHLDPDMGKEILLWLRTLPERSQDVNPDSVMKVGSHDRQSSVM